MLMYSIRISKPGTGLSRVVRATTEAGRRLVEGRAQQLGYCTRTTNHWPVPVKDRKNGR